MKNVMFSLAAVAFLSLSSFTTTNSVSSDIEEVGTVPCKWRTVVYSSGVAHYSEWTHGNCNVTDSGRLIPIK